MTNDKTNEPEGGAPKTEDPAKTETPAAGKKSAGGAVSKGDPKAAKETSKKAAAKQKATEPEDKPSTAAAAPAPTTASPARATAPSPPPRGVTGGGGAVPPGAKGTDRGRAVGLKSPWMVSGLLLVLFVVVLLVVVGIYDSRMAALEADNARLTTSAAGLQQKIDEERSAVGDYPSAVEALAAIKKELTAAETRRGETTAAIDVLEAQRKQSEDALLALNEQITAGRKTLDGLEKELASARTDVEGAMVQKEEAQILEARIADLNHQVNELESRRTQLMNLVGSATKKLDAAAKSLEAIHGQLSQ